VNTLPPPAFDEHVFYKFPALETPRLILREINREDCPEIFRLYTDERILTYFGKEPFKSEDDAAQWVHMVQFAFMNKQGIRWGLVSKESGKYIGSIGYWKILREHLRAELGYELAPEAWKHGYMREAMHAVLDFGFSKMKLHSIEANVTPENEASVSLLKSQGFMQEGLFRSNYFFDGAFADTASFSLLDRDFLKE
jgi:ribosomal-protein-alanine N-acetyltransferase